LTLSQVRLALACIVWNHPHLLVLDEITTHLDFYTVTALSKALRAFNGALLLVTHDRFLLKCVIDGNTELLGMDDEEEFESEDETQVQPQRSLYRLQKGGLVLLDRGIQDFEEDLEKRVAKLAL
jgi:ATPase subunit of ABC transporter with duplicated ATPase domains